MKNDVFDRRTFLKGAVAGSAAAVIGALPQPVPAQQDAPAPVQQDAPAPAQLGAPAQPATSAGYSYLNLEEQAFVEALVDHMVPADELTPKGTDLGLNIYIDRALSGSWGKGDRLYMQGPWKPGVPSQGYQLPLTPAALYREGIAAANRHCMKTYGKLFDKISENERESVLRDLDSGKLVFEDGPPARAFFDIVYQTVIEGMFADPIYGGNKNKAGWKMLGFPGVIQVNQQNIVNFKNKKFPGETTGIADMS
jgi:gluconate 2-dehydrogenase gamma chain